MRYRFADNYIIQTTFKSSSSVQDVFEFLKTLLLDPSKEIQLKIPPNILYDYSCKSTLVNEGLGPSVSFLVFDAVNSRRAHATQIILPYILSNTVTNPDSEQHQDTLENLKGLSTRPSDVVKSETSDSSKSKSFKSRFVKL